MKEFQTVLCIGAAGVGAYYLYKQIQDKKQISYHTQLPNHHPPANHAHIPTHLPMPPRLPMVSPFRHLPNSHHFLR